MDENDLIKDLYAKDSKTPGLARARAVLTDHIAGGRHLDGRRPKRGPARRQVYVISGAAALAAVAALSLSVLPGMVGTGGSAGAPAGTPARTSDQSDGRLPSEPPSEASAPEPTDPAALSHDPDARTETFRYVRVDGALSATGDYASAYLPDDYPPVDLDFLYLSSRGWQRAEMWVPTEPGHDYMISSPQSGMAPRIGTADNPDAQVGCDPPSAGDTDYPPLSGALYPDIYFDCTNPGDWDYPTLAFIDSLPTDPAGLLARAFADWEAANPPGVDVELYVNLPSPEVGEFNILSCFLASPILPDDMRSTALQALELIPGVGVAPADNGDTVLSLTDRGLVRYELTVDPGTNLVQSYRATIVDGNVTAGLPTGTVIEATLTWAEVTGLGTRPDGLSADDPPVNGITVPGGGLSAPPTP